MAEPKKKLSRTRSRQRRSHDKIIRINLVECKKCKSMIRPHIVCKVCGYYKGEKILDLKEKTTKKTDEENLKDE